jgi:hypothetical protein
MKTAYSRARFSSKKQGKEHALRRQTGGWAEGWCQEDGYRLEALEPDKGSRRSTDGVSSSEAKAASLGFPWLIFRL